MNRSKLAAKDLWERFPEFFCNAMPVISLCGIGVCWLVYLAAPRGGRDISAYSHAFWVTMGIITWLCIIFGVLFVISLIAHLIVRPLPDRNAGLHIFLRTVIAAAAAAATYAGVWLSVFVFSFLGY